MLHPHQLKVPMMSTLNENIDSPKPPFPGKNRQALAEDSHIAAFFDLDKTILATASAMALSSPLVHAGVMSRWDSLRATIVQLPYLFTGADDDRMRSMMHALGELTRGWDPQYVEKIVNSVTSSSIAPLCYRQALALIDHHRLLGHHVVIASASPMEIVRPIAHLLSIPDALSTIVGRGQDGLVDGTITHFNHGAGKDEACRKLADERGWDLSESYAYTDSVSDLPMLELVGHPQAVNPDRSLAAIAREREWPIHTFTQTVRIRSRKRTRMTLAMIPVALVGGIGIGYWARRSIPSK